MSNQRNYLSLYNLSTKIPRKYTIHRTRRNNEEYKTYKRCTSFSDIVSIRSYTFKSEVKKQKAKVFC